MNENPEKAARKPKQKQKREAPPDMTESIRYSRIMYGRTTTELKLLPKRVDHGASYLRHPKFQNLMAAFRKGAEAQFEITAGDAVSVIATSGGSITFQGRVLFYTRPQNHYENNLFLDREAAVQFQGQEAAVHLVFAVVRSFPELGDAGIRYQYHKLYHGDEVLESVSTGLNANILLGAFRNGRPSDRNR
jgi:hypothetical protein